MYVLHAPDVGGEMRALIHLCDPRGELNDELQDFAKISNRGALPFSSVNALSAGPNHPGFKAALRANNFTYSPVCDEGVVERAVEMMVAAEMLPALLIEDDAVHASLMVTFSTDDDWERLFTSAQNAARSILTVHKLITDETTDEEIIAVVQLSSAICVAMIQARAEWSQNAREQVE